MMLRTLAAAAALSAPAAVSAQSLENAAFLEGAWRGGGEDFVFEEIWSAPEGGVMTAMARGVSGGKLQVLEYVVLAEEADGLVMRFMHFRADYSTWEAPGETIVLPLTDAAPEDLLFENDDPEAEVASIRYALKASGELQVDVALREDDGPGGFSLVFSRVGGPSASDE